MLGYFERGTWCDIATGKLYYAWKASLKLHGEWQDAIVYRRIEDPPEGETFVRQYVDFLQRFRHVLTDD